jgi:hypothetical protein
MRWQRSARGSRIRAANTARSAQSRRGLGLVRRCTATRAAARAARCPWWRTGRPSSKTSLSTCRRADAAAAASRRGTCPTTEAADHRCSQRVQRSGTPQGACGAGRPAIDGRAQAPDCPLRVHNGVADSRSRGAELSTVDVSWRNVSMGSVAPTGSIAAAEQRQPDQHPNKHEIGSRGPRSHRASGARTRAGRGARCPSRHLLGQRTGSVRVHRYRGELA